MSILSAVNHRKKRKEKESNEFIMKRFRKEIIFSFLITKSLVALYKLFEGKVERLGG